MLVELLLWILIPLILLGLLHHYLPRVGHWLFWISAVLFILTLVGGILLFFDAKTFADRMASAQNRFLLEQDGRIIAGLDMDSLMGEGVIYHDVQALIRLSDAYAGHDEDGLRGGTYKVFLFKSEAFGGLESVEFFGKRYTISYLLSLFDEGDPLRKVMADQHKGSLDGLLSQDQFEDVLKQAKADMGISSAAQFKGYLFASLFTKGLQQQGPFFILEQFRKGNIVIIEETITFTFLRWLPEPVYRFALEKANLYKPEGS